VPGVPLIVLVVLLGAVTTVSAPFMAARGATNRDVLGEKFQKGNAITLTAYYLAQVAGLGGGAAVTAALGVRGCLLADAGTFAVSVLVVWHWVQFRPAADDRPRGPQAPGYRSGLRVVFGNPAARLAVLLLWVVMFSVAAEGVALPLARELGGGSRAAGLILAVPVVGTVIALQLWDDKRVPAVTRRRLAGFGPLGLCGLLLLFFATPPLIPALVILAASGAFACYINSSNAVFVKAVPGEDLGKAFGVADAGLFLGQGAAVIGAGALAGLIRPAYVIAVFAAAGTLLAIPLAIAWRRQFPAEQASEQAQPEQVTSVPA
jgi:Major Facilitator Superfamily